LLDRAMVVTPSEYSLIRQATLLEKIRNASISLAPVTRT